MQDEEEVRATVPGAAEQRTREGDRHRPDERQRYPCIANALERRETDAREPGEPRGGRPDVSTFRDGHGQREQATHSLGQPAAAGGDAAAVGLGGDPQEKRQQGTVPRRETFGVEEQAAHGAAGFELALDVVHGRQPLVNGPGAGQPQHESVARRAAELERRFRCHDRHLVDDLDAPADLLGEEDAARAETLSLGR